MREALSGPLVSRRGAAMLTLGTLGSGVLAYAFNAIAAHALGPAGYGPVAVLWAAVFLVSIVLFRPVEQTLSRSIAERIARGVDARPVVRSAVRLSLLAATLPMIAVAIAWGPLTERLFHGQDVLTAALAAGIVGYGLSFFVRGVIGGLRWFGGYGILLLADGAVRLALVLPLAVVAAPWVAAIAVAGAALGGALAPLAAGGWAARRHLRAPAEARFELGHAVAFAAPVAVIAAMDQLLISGGPLLIVLASGAGAVTAAGKVFAATMLVRAPAFLFQGFAAALLPSLTTLEAVGDGGRLRRSVMAAAGALAALTAAGAAAALLAGPAAMKLLYGSGFEVARGDLALLAVGIGCYLAASTFSQAALARSDTRPAAAVWTLAALMFVSVELALSGAPMHRVSVAFAAATAVSAALLFGLVVRRPHAARPTATLEPVGATQVSA